MSAAHKTLRAKSIVLLKRPVGMPSPVLGETIGLRESDVPGEAPADGLLVHLGYFSVDPYLRGVLGNTPDNTIINGYVAGTVLESKLGEWKKGDLFGANLPFTTYQALTKAQLGTFRKLTDYVSPSELSLAIGLLGMPGSTAYAGLDLMGVGENDSVWISAATGAVGSVAGQIAKNVRKAKLVIGSAGSAEKCATAVKEFGFDACFNYKDAKNATELTSLVKKHAPEGIDFYFENVGGDHFAAAMSNLRPHGRVSVCGAISRYNTTEATLPSEPLSFGQIIYKQQRVEGFLCTDWLMGKRGNFIEDMSKWHKAGIVNSKETVFEGVEKWPEAFHALFIQGGENLGKIVVKIQD